MLFRSQLTESEFDAANYAVGEHVLATWDPVQASPLNTSSSVAIPPSDKAA